MNFKCVNSSRVRLENMEEPGGEGISVRWLINKEDGAPNFAMRLFELAPKGHSPFHSHNWEHEVYILQGSCKIKCGSEEKTANSGYVVFIPPKAKHQFANVGRSTLKFLCIVPHRK